MSVHIYDLTHTFEPFMPQWPSGCNLKEEVIRFHANDDMYDIQWEGIMHRGTHMDAPLHVTELTPDITQYPLWRFFGTGVALDIPKGKWGKLEPEDLMKYDSVIKEGDIVLINTSQHHIWKDSDDYFAYGCGATGELAKWFVEKKVKMVGYGCQANDHPIATKLVDHGLGPTRPDLIDEWEATYGHDPKEDFPLWEPGHKFLMVEGGIPGVENVGDDAYGIPEGESVFDEITGRRCFFAAFPWRFVRGEGSGVRVLALTDPDQTFRFETGE
ncbi:MAG: cyclase family protein [Oscillospiraceae bacterium]|nr:cyclase family protein [Oscillospiraceae bacterium]